MSSSDDDYYGSYYQDASSSTASTGAKKAISHGWQIAAAYLLVWAVILVVFRIIYLRYRASLKKRNRGGAEIGKHTNAWFGPHREREAYEAVLLHDDSAKEKDEAVTEESLRKLLLRRAMTDLRRAWRLQEEKDSVYKLMRSGAVSEAMWEEFKEAESGLQIEIYDLQAEAETFRVGWGKEILRDAAALIKREKDLQMMKEALVEREKERSRQSSSSESIGAGTRARVTAAP